MTKLEFIAEVKTKDPIILKTRKKVSFGRIEK